MSGYLPPHGTGGACSELYKSEWTLQNAPLRGDDKDITEHYLLLNSGTTPTLQTLITLGPDPEDPLLKVHPIGFGLWGWGDVLTYGWGPSNGYDQKLNDESVAGAWHEIFRLSSHMLLDTAEHYGYTDGYSESSVGKLLSQDGKDTRSKLVFATKFFPTPWRHPWKYPDITLQSARHSLERSKVGKIDIYQLHGPSHWGFWPKLETLCEALAQAYQTGKCKTIGTCNLNLEQVRYVYTYMRKRDIPFVSNQVEFSLVRMDPLTTGLIEGCRKLGIATIAYSPIAVGRLTGKYSQQNLPRGNRNFGHVDWSKLDPILEELKRVGEKHGKTPTAVALNWVMCKGAIPIPTPKNKEQVQDCLQALGWRLSKNEEDRLDALGLTNAWDWNLLKHFQNWWWQQG